MTLLNKARHWKVLGFLAVMGGAFVISHALRTNFLYVVVPASLAGALLARISASWVVNRAARRILVLTEAQQYAAARNLIEELRVLMPETPAARDALRLVEGTAMGMEGRHADAVALLSSIDSANFSPAIRPALLNSLAWSLALSGEPASAIPLARESLAAPDGALKDHDWRATRLNTLGTALVLAGEPDEGVSLLKDSLACSVKPRRQALGAFYLGEGLRALGKHDEAVTAYERAIQEEPSSESAARAKAALAGMHAYRS